jgi:hypothetical protein
MVVRQIKWRNIDSKSIFYNKKTNHKILVLGDLSTLTLNLTEEILYAFVQKWSQK